MAIPMQLLLSFLEEKDQASFIMSKKSWTTAFSTLLLSIKSNQLLTREWNEIAQLLENIDLESEAQDVTDDLQA